MKDSFTFWAAFLLCGIQIANAEMPRLTDEQAREVAGAAIYPVYPEPCYSTYRNEHLESWMLSLRIRPIVDRHIDNSVYFYRVASNGCEYVVEKDGNQVPMMQAISDCCEYGLVAVDRETRKGYWFGGRQKAADVFKEFVRDEQLQPDLSTTLFTALYLDLVWGDDRDNEITSLAQLRDLAESNFQSAYSPYEQDTKWEHKFDSWWRKFQSHMRGLALETTYETVSGGTLVRGYSFSGFELTRPRTDPPPKGKPKLWHWALLVKPDGTVEEQPRQLVYASR